MIKKAKGWMRKVKDMVMINFLQQAKGRELIISEEKKIKIVKEWKFRWTKTEEFEVISHENDFEIKSCEISKVREKLGILILYKYEENVKIEIEIL